MSEGGSQLQDWIDFYEGAWAFRAQYIQELIAAGESHPMRLIAQLEAKQRKYEIGRDPQSGKARFQRMKLDVPVSPSGIPDTRMTAFRGQFVRVPAYAVTHLYHYVIDYIDEHGPFDALVELGCGFGQNLFKIYYNGGPKIPYFGGELTHSGVALAQQLAQLGHLASFSFFGFNHLKPDLSKLPRMKKVLFFTMHTIEQVNRVGLDLIKTIAGAAEAVTCLHFEPFGFQTKELGEASVSQKKYFADKKWNENLAMILSQAHQENIIRIDYTGLELFFPDDPYNAPSVALWRSGRGVG